MIAYLIYSTLSMGFLLLFYHLVMEKEKMHTINRGYLIFSLIFSLSIPLIPVGLTYSVLPWSQNQQSTEIQLFPYSTLLEGEWVTMGSDEMGSVTNSGAMSLESLLQLGFWIYTIIVGFLFIRLLRIIHMIQLKADRNFRKLFDDYEIVLLKEKVIPHTFMSTIFLNKEEYLKGEIASEVLVHELTHARQKHTLDILFIEILKIVFWFNPILYFYKKAILLNHEFLADEAVIRRGAPVSSYQKLLLKSLLVQPSKGLISQFNYALTKKRLHMMTQNYSKIRSTIKLAALLPMFTVLALFLGCESTTTEYAEQETAVEELNIEIIDSVTLNVNSTEMSFSEMESYFSQLSEHPEKVYLKVGENADSGIVWDTQQLFRERGIALVDYTTEEKDIKDELNLVAQQFDRATDVYMEMDVLNTDMQTLEDQFDEVMKYFEEMVEIYKDIPDAPPPPPYPPSPEKRLEIHIKSNLDTENEPPPVRSKNLLRIELNQDGQLLMNLDPVNLNEIKERIKQFVDNHGATSELSENPREAILAIKTDRQTPHEMYTTMLDEVMAAYDELRDEAALRQFGTEFSSLGEDSDQRTEIMEMYPKKISIRPPDGI